MGILTLKVPVIADAPVAMVVEPLVVSVPVPVVDSETEIGDPGLLTAA